MPEPTRCPKCGALLLADTPGGQCPRCLLGLAEDPGDPPSAPAADHLFPAGRGEGTPTRIHYFGDYELLEVIGQGGMGKVWRARQISLNRTVALKMIHAGRFAGPEEVARFHREAEAAASLDHPNIVHIFEVGEHEGQHYFTMKFVEGGTLAAVVAARQSAANSSRAEYAALCRDAATMISKIARALHHAHQRGIMHRDLKPANILRDGQGELLIADFGLARLIDQSVDPARPDGILGTIGYMAPEQVSGQATALTTAVDIHALGCILYELLTGRTPYRARNLTEAVQSLPTETVIPLRGLNPRVDRDLESICLHCLEKQPEQRYQSAAALAEDLERWLRGEPVSTRIVGPVSGFARWARRHPRKLALVAFVFLVVAEPLTLEEYRFLRRRGADSSARPLIQPDRFGAFELDLTDESPPRCTANFKASRRFVGEGSQVVLRFANVPPQVLLQLRVRILADLGGRPDAPRSPVLTNGQVFRLKLEPADRACYFIAEDFNVADLCASAPDARILLSPHEPAGSVQSVSAARPRISLVQPLIAPAHAAIKISGTNFSVQPDENVVYFGPVRAKVTTATTAELSVKVPLGAVFGTVSVTTPAGRTAYSGQPFLPSFTSAGDITSSTLDEPVYFASPVPPLAAALNDLDNDGKPDLLFSSTGGFPQLFCYWNTGRPDAIDPGSFSDYERLPGYGGGYGLASADLDGDGKLDVITLDTSGWPNARVAIYRNSNDGSTRSNLTAAGAVLLRTSIFPHSLAIHDLDEDGRPDLLLPDYANDEIHLLHNRGGVLPLTSSWFAVPVSIPAARAYQLAVGDLDGDGKPDVVVPGINDTLQVFRNTASPGRMDTNSLSLAGRFDLPRGGKMPTSAVMVDLDGDGKLDVVVAHDENPRCLLSVLRNTSSPGNISFEPPIAFPAPGNGWRLEIADFNGDGRPDVTVVHYVRQPGATIFQNNSTRGSISLSAAATIGGDIKRSATLVVGDFDLDGKPDVILASDREKQFAIFRNQTAGAPTPAPNR